MSDPTPTPRGPATDAKLLGEVTPPRPPATGTPQAVAAKLINGVDLDPWCKVLIYADPGAGKTKFAATAPKPLFIDTENSTETLRDWPELAAECKIVRLQGWSDLDSIVAALRGGDPEYSDRQTLVIDTISELQRRNLDELLDDRARNNSSRSRFLAHQQDYKESGEMMRRITTAFRDLPMHLVVLSHAREVNNDGKLVMRPDLTPKLQDTMRGIFGLQGFMFESNDDWNAPFKNYLQTRSNAVIQAKTRYRHLPALIENPTFDMILEASSRYLHEQPQQPTSEKE